MSKLTGPDGQVVFVPGSSEWWEKMHARSRKPIEQLQIDDRIKLEQRYKREPRETQADLIERGYWYVAAQLKIDHQAGRL